MSKSFFQRLGQTLTSLRNMRITQKMIIGYILMVFLPILLFGFVLYHQFFNNIRDEYASGKQRLMVQANDNLSINLAQTTSVYQLLQYNSEVVEYLDGRYIAESDQVYTFLKNIRPMFNFAYLGNSFINSIRLYKMNRQVLPVDPEIPDSSELRDPDLNIMMDRMPPAKGDWLATPGNAPRHFPTFMYYQNVYNDNYTKKLAILQVSVNEGLIRTFAETMSAGQSNNLVFIDDQDRILYSNRVVPLSAEELKFIKSKLSGSRSPFFYWADKKEIVNSLHVNTLHFHVYLFSPSETVFRDLRSKANWTALLMVVLLLVLSFLYYLFSFMLSRRIIRLARHMRKVDENRLVLYEGDGVGDEIGVLTSSYNLMIRRIDELINTVHRVELMKKEADYQVLQAQIKPHFLYNTLESIKMLAELNDDAEVVEATYTLAQLLRYSLSSGDNESTLQQELTNIEHYLKIHKLRMGDRLNYQVNVLAQVGNIRCPRFILQPLVENCIAHGISKQRKKGMVSILAEDRENELWITITDNGPGIPPERLETVRSVLNHSRERKTLETETGGHGLYNVSERVKAFFGPDSRLELDSVPGEGTIITLILKI